MEITPDRFLSLLTKSQEFSEHVINNYPEIAADVRSFREDPDCSCKHIIAKFFNNNEEKIMKNAEAWSGFSKLSSYLKSPKDNSYRNVLKSTLSVEEQANYTDVIGEIIEIAPDPNEYKRIISIARENWLYNGINILETVKFDPQTKKESVVWLLLFY